MATTKKTAEVIETVAEATEVTIKEPELVEVYIERAIGDEDPNFYVGVNGKGFLLPRGQTSLVPPYIKEEIDRARRAERRLDETVNRLIELSK